MFEISGPSRADMLSTRRAEMLHHTTLLCSAQLCLTLSRGYQCPICEILRTISSVHVHTYMHIYIYKYYIYHVKVLLHSLDDIYFVNAMIDSPH